MNITETQISQWADSYNSRGLLPILIRKLIQETIPANSLGKISFHGDSAVDLPGFDGITDSLTHTDKIPKGTTYWEFGTNQNFKTKANDDYQKRVKNTSEEIRLKTTYIFVTPRRWPNKEQWEQEKNNEQNWKHIKIYDATDLAIWLERSPITTCWFKNELDIPTEGLIIPEIWWKNWAYIEGKELTYEIVSSRCNDEKKQLIQFLQEHQAIINIYADNQEEGIAFVIATLLQSKSTLLLDNTIIINSPNAQPITTNNHLIVINLLDNNTCLSLCNKEALTIIKIFPKGLEQDVVNKIVLSHIPFTVFCSELQKMGIEKEKSKEIAQSTALSIPVLRRYLSNDPSIKTPDWAKNHDNIKKVLPFAFCGAYKDNKNYDDKSILYLLSGNESEKVIKQNELDLLKLNDSPLITIENITKIISITDIFFVIGPYISDKNLKDFFSIVELILLDKKPYLELPIEQWWAASVYEKGSPYSAPFLKGIKNNFCFLAVNGQHICNKNSVDCSFEASQIVNNCLSTMSEEKWLMIQEDLPILAEAAPETFLTCLEKELFVITNPSYKVLFKNANDTFTEPCLRSNLLWALEILAWYPNYFKRVVKILLELNKFNITDNYSNTPYKTICSLFRPFLPSTLVGIEDKLKILHEFSQQYRTTIFKIYIHILINNDSFITPNIMPKWRNLDKTLRENIITSNELYDYFDKLTDLLYLLTPFDTYELKEILTASYNLSYQNLQQLKIFIAQWINTATDQDKNDFSNIISNILEYKKLPQNYKSLYNYLMSILKPTTIQVNFMELFDNYYQWLQKNGYKNLSFEEKEKIKKKEQESAIIELQQQLSVSEFLDFIINLKQPYNIIKYLITEKSTINEILNWFNKFFTFGNSDKVNSILKNILYLASYYNYKDAFTQLPLNFINKNKIEKQRLVLLLPTNALGWNVAFQLGNEIVEYYWKNTIFYYSSDYSPEEINFAVKNFLQVNRPSAACLYALHHYTALSIETWITIFFDMIEYNDLVEAHYFDQFESIFLYIDREQKKYKDEIIKLEIMYYKLIFTYTKIFHDRIPLIYKELSRDPDFFIELQSTVYQENIDRNFATIIYDILYYWDILPGSFSPTENQEQDFQNWTNHIMNKHLSEKETTGFQLRMANLLAKVAYKNKDTYFLEEYLINFIELPQNIKLQKQFLSSYINERGVTSRTINEGGNQERELASFYINLSKQYEIHHPIFATIIKNIANYFEELAIEEDNEAIYNERFL